jgi:predicted PolB exonuclease-like 3'-5' exonuclease
MTMNILVFDIETIPDVNAGRQCYDLPADMGDETVAEVMFEKRREQTDGSDFLKHYLHQIVAISVVLREKDKLSVWSIGDANNSEAEILQRFFDGIERYTPTIVTWNGSNFDLPVLHYRSLFHGTYAGRYWESGNTDNNFKYNNYLNRYHERHTDLMDVLSAYQPRATAKLDEIATFLNLPGKMGMDGSQVWPAYLADDLDAIRNYCETDVLNTYLIYLRFMLIQGKLTNERYQHEYQLVKSTLLTSKKAHLEQFANTLL